MSSWNTQLRLLIPTNLESLNLFNFVKHTNGFISNNEFKIR